MFSFGNPVVRKEEKRQRIVGEVEVLKKQQKVEVERITKEYAVKQANTVDAIDAQIGSLKAQIASLNQEKKDKVNILAEELKVEIDKTINDYDSKIIAKKNKAKKLGYLIDAERKSEEDAINPDQPNAPTEKPTMGFKPLLEDKTTEKKKATKKTK